MGRQASNAPRCLFSQGRVQTNRATPLAGPLRHLLTKYHSLNGCFRLVVVLAWAVGFPDPLVAQLSRTDIQLDRSQQNYRELVENLAHQDAAIRNEAFELLSQAGVSAFDALYAARTSTDLEQRLAVERLLKRTQIPWPEDLPFNLRQIVLHFHNGRASQKVVCIEMMRRNFDPRAAEVLSLITRFELDETTSRFAALNLIRLLDDCDDQTRYRAISTSFLESTGELEREGVHWVRSRILSHDNTQQFARTWLETLEGVVNGLEGRNHDPTHYENRLIATRLSLWVAEELAQRNQSQTAGRVIDRIVEHIEPDWIPEVLLLARQYRMIDPARRVADLHATSFNEDPMAVFHLARIELESGSEEVAARLVDRAVEMSQSYASTTLETAVQLQHFGYFDWAGRLLQSVINRDRTPPVSGARCVLMLADQQFSNGRFEEAIHTLTPLVERLSDDRDLADSVARHIGPARAEIHSRLCLFHAMSARQAGDTEIYKQYLIEGLSLDSTQSELLIAAYRCPLFDPETSNLIAQLVESRLSRLKSELSNLEMTRIGPGNVRLEKNQNRRSASLANSYAWLAINTDGAPEEALEYAALANRLSPDTAAYLDTEARCRFATGDEDGAIRCQRMACQIEPASQELKRQLGVYRRYRAATRETPLAGTIMR